jgi:ParB/RepB/Spo0J family partition protein
VTLIDHPTRTSGPDPDPAPKPARSDTEPAAAGLAVAGRVLLELDPRRLQENPHNPRTQLGDLTELTDSICAVGVLEPLIVTPTDDGGHVLLFGHRRRAAAIAAGLATVPCDARAEYAGRSAEQVADMLAENLHRRDLTGLEEAAGYEQLSMFDGWTADRIAGRIGRTVEHVRAGLAAAKVSAELRPKVVDGGLTLEQAAAIEAYAADPKAYQRLLRAANYAPGLHHALADERHRREVADRKVSTRRELADAGVRIIGKPNNFPWSSVEARVRELTNADGELLTVETHTSCPGHAAFIDDDGAAVFVCQHPKDWRHGTPPSYRHRSKDEIRADEQAAQARREQEEALTVADAARASFLHEYLSRKGRPPAGTLRTALQILASREQHYGSTRSEAGHLLHPDADSDSAAAVFVEAVAKTTDNRLPLLALAYAAAAAEANMRSRQASWQFDPELAVRWLTVLDGFGYPLSEVESRLRTYWSTPLEDEDDLLDGDLPDGDTDHDLDEDEAGEEAPESD